MVSINAFFWGEHLLQIKERKMYQEIMEKIKGVHNQLNYLRGHL